MANVKNPYPLCFRDQFPMVKIGNQQQCVAEYLDHHLGQKKIVDVVQHQDTTYYVFENQYELPLLCFCCGVPLQRSEALEQLRREMCGRRLESMSVGTATASDGEEFLEFQLEFSARGGEEQGVTQSLAPEAAAQLRRPPGTKGRSKKKRGFG